jgi:hypothetical protein
VGRRNISNAIQEISSFNDNPFSQEEGFAIPVNVKTIHKITPSGESFSYDIELESQPHVKLYFSSKLKSDLQQASGNANKIFNYMSKKYIKQQNEQPQQLLNIDGHKLKRITEHIDL